MLFHDKAICRKASDRGSESPVGATRDICFGQTVRMVGLERRAVITAAVSSIPETDGLDTFPGRLDPDLELLQCFVPFILNGSHRKEIPTCLNGSFKRIVSQRKIQLGKAHRIIEIPGHVAYRDPGSSTV
jgi:hypothetical protein